MNFKFEKELLLSALQGSKYNSVYEDRLTTLQGMKIAIDASVLLNLAKKYANPQKFIQEGGACLDSQLQQGLVKIIDVFRTKYEIQLVVVMDGLLPKFVSEQQNNNILQKSHIIWDKLQETHQSGNNQELYMNLLNIYGSRCFLTEIMNACLETNTDFFVAPYAATP